MVDKFKLFIVDFSQMIRTLGQIFKLVLLKALNIAADLLAAAVTLMHCSQIQLPRDCITIFEPLSRRLFVPL